jgi:RimJ/RimL family protein N-acetyltransferase
MWLELNLGDVLVRTLNVRDADLLVDATRTESGKALWGPRPVGAYGSDDAMAALREWDPELGGQTSFGVLAGERLVGALGLMPDEPGSAELAYWVRPEDRGRGIAARTVRAITEWALADGGLSRVWLEIGPENTASLRVAERAGFLYEERLADHCRQWIHEDPRHDVWQDCLIWARHTIAG